MGLIFEIVTLLARLAATLERRKKKFNNPTQFIHFLGNLKIAGVSVGYCDLLALGRIAAKKAQPCYTDLAQVQEQKWLNFDRDSGDYSLFFH